MSTTELNKVKFDKSYLMGEFDLPFNHEIILEDKIVDTGRWSEHHELIFKLNDKIYKTWYSCGLTEMQEESPWEYEDMIECIEVEPYEKIVTDYRYVEK